MIGALHNVSALDLGDVDSPLGDVLVCGDNPDAKTKVMEIITRIGARTFDGGTAAHEDGVRGIAFIEAAVKSSTKDGKWVKV